MLWLFGDNRQCDEPRSACEDCLVRYQAQGIQALIVRDNDHALGIRSSGHE